VLSLNLKGPDMKKPACVFYKSNKNKASEKIRMAYKEDRKIIKAEWGSCRDLRPVLHSKEKKKSR
jgi:hypothetical protein